MITTVNNLKIYLLSDIHLEFEPSLNVDAAKTADVIILAGDIGVGTYGLHWARKTFPGKDIVYVAGNHEFYHHDYHTLLCDFRGLSDQLGIHFLENKEVTINGVRFLGCTLWTDYLASPGLTQQQGMKVSQKSLADHRLIKYNGNLFTPDDALELNQKSVKWLESKLFEETSLSTIVVTHHGPSLACFHKKYGHSELASAFYSDLDYLVEKADLWMYGHTHSNLDTVISGTRLISNQLGYPNEDVEGFIG